MNYTVNVSPSVTEYIPKAGDMFVADHDVTCAKQELFLRVGEVIVVNISNPKHSWKVTGDFSRFGFSNVKRVSVQITVTEGAL